MALQKSFSDKYGNSHSAAYYRVTALTIDFHNSKAYAEMCVYKDITARNSNKEPINIIKYSFGPDKFPNIFNTTAMENKNPLKGVYDEVKTYSEFEGSTDV